MYDRYWRQSPFDTESISVPQCAAIWVIAGNQRPGTHVVERGNSIDIYVNGVVAGSISLSSDGTEVSISGTHNVSYVNVTFVLLGSYDYN